MAEENLPEEELEDFDSLLSDAQNADMDDAGGLGDDLDDIFGQEGGEEDAFGAEDTGGEGDSDLDSFFEDLSTIDDLEVLQEDEEEAPAETESAMEEEVGAPEPPAAAAPAAAAPAAKPPKPPREKKPRGPLFKLIKWLILLGLLGGGGYYAYQFFFPEFPMPWSVIEEEREKLASVFEKKIMEPPALPPPAPVVVAPPPRPRPAPVRKPEPPREHGPWSIQIASCFFDSCLDNYRAFLKATNRSVVLVSRTARSETLEIHSISTFQDREVAQQMADRINKEHPLEGHAYVIGKRGGYRISMGSFTDLSRAKVIKEALNQQFYGDVAFATQLKNIPYKVQSVMTGRFPSRSAANQALAQLKDKEPRLKNAFVARNR